MKRIQTDKELKLRNIKPIKHRGQNFLVSEEIIKKIIESVKIKPNETILEVGPGTGNLTEALLRSGANIIAVEKDDGLVQLLNSKFQTTNPKQILNSKLQITKGDILSFDETIIKKPYRIVANIPYYLTGKLIQKFLLSPNKPAEMVLMVQKEVGERITAQPPKANYLSSLVQFLAYAEILFNVKKENFWPQPEVDSVIIKLTPLSKHVNTRQRSPVFVNINKIGEIEKYIKFLKHVFRQPRQTLFNNLRKSGLTNINNLEKLFTKMKFDKNIRPQNLNQEKLIKIFKSIMVY